MCGCAVAVVHVCRYVVVVHACMCGYVVAMVHACMCGCAVAVVVLGFEPKT